MWAEIYNRSRQPVPDCVDSHGQESLQIHFGSSKEALQELGYFLIGLSMMDTNHNDFSWGFDIATRDHLPMLHLVFHTPSDVDNPRPKFPEIHTIAKTTID